MLINLLSYLPVPAIFFFLLRLRLIRGIAYMDVGEGKCIAVMDYATHRHWKW